MTEKRYYKKDWEESYYIFDSNTISEDEFEERVEYEGYDVFGDSLTGDEVIDLLNENEELKELLELISRASSFTKEESVKEILRHEIKAIDTVTEDSAMAWNDYCALSNFFKKQYGEHWDNE